MVQQYCFPLHMPEVEMTPIKNLRLKTKVSIMALISKVSQTYIWSSEYLAEKVVSKNMSSMSRIATLAIISHLSSLTEDVQVGHCTVRPMSTF